MRPFDWYPPPEQAYAAESVPEANETRKPRYSGVDVRTRSTRAPPIAADTSGNVPSAAALIKPGAWRLGTSVTCECEWSVSHHASSSWCP